jgi:hypothetical protein
MLVEDVRLKISEFTLKDWFSLGVYQDFQQLIIKSAFADSMLEHQLKQEVSQTLEGSPQALFRLTCSELIDQLVDEEKVLRSDGKIAVHPIWLEVITRYLDGHSDPFLIPQREEAPSREEKKIAPSTREYVDPLSRISDEVETLFTTRRLDAALTALDGLTLLQDGLRQLLSMENSTDFTRLLESMETFELIRCEGQYVKLDLHGNKVIRLARPERLKALGLIAKRMRGR